MTTVYESFLLCSAKDILGKLHQEEALAVRVKDVSQALSLVFKKITNTGAGHQVEVFIITHLLCVTETNTMLDAPLIITDEEALLLMLVVIAVVQDKLMQFGELSITVDEDFQYKVILLLAEKCQF